LQSKKEVFKAQHEQYQAAGKMDGLREELQDIAQKYGGSFKLPPYFALILRVFATLEGLGLKTNKDFAIVQACFPYIARRLLTDDSIRMRNALKTYLYKGQRRISATRIDEMVNGFGKFANMMSATQDEQVRGGAPQGGKGEQLVKATPRGGTDVQTLEPVEVDQSAKDIAEIIFSPEGNFLQDLLIDEGVAAVDALSRVAVLNLLKSLGPLSLPISMPLSFLLGARATGDDLLSQEDRESLMVIRRIVRLVQGKESHQGEDDEEFAMDTSVNVFEVAEDVAKLRPLAEGLLPTITPGAAAFAKRFAQQLARRILMRVADDIEQLTLGPWLATA